MMSQFDLLNSFNDSIAVIDSDGQILFTNDSWKKFCITNSGELIKADKGINYIEVCKLAKGEDRSFAADAVNGILKVIKGELTVFELEYPCHSANEMRWFILRATPLKGHKNLTLLSHINITKRKEAEEMVERRNHQLHKINSKLNLTMRKIVHDIQGPLNSVEGLVSISKAEKKLKDTKQILALIESSVLKLKEFIHETLKLSTLEIKNESIEFKKILEEFYESIKYSEMLKNVDLKFNVEQNSNFFNNKPEVISIISNLVINSLKYYDAKKEKPSVIISITTTIEEARISIKDNGIGISQEYLSKIFGLKFQIKEGTSGGAGIGLYLVKKAVKSLNGQLNINSKIGEGTEVTIVLPNANNIEKNTKA